MAASGTGPLNFTDDLRYDDSSRMNLEGYKPSCLPIFKKMPPDSLGSASYCIRTMTQTPCQFTQGIYKGKEMESLRLPESVSRFKSDWTWISPAEEESEGRNSPKQATIGIGCIKGWKSISKDETKSLVMSMYHRLTAVIVRKRSATK